MPAIEQRDGHVLLRVRVQPKASRNAMLTEAGGHVRVALTAPPVAGAANKALRAFLAKALGLPKGAVSLHAGAKSREKTVRLDGARAEAIQARLAESGAVSVISGVPNVIAATPATARHARKEEG